MRRFAVGIEFCGMQYKGWQTQQAGVLTVQETLEKVLSKIANEPILLHGAGRTDAGVHATNMVAHFDTDAIRPLTGWLMGANSILPKDIAIQWIKAMDSDFHARFKAQARRYRYVVYNHPQRPALLHKQVTHVYSPLNTQKMIEMTKKFEGIHNFESFQRDLPVQSTCPSCDTLSFNSAWPLFSFRYSGRWFFTSYGSKYHGLPLRNWSKYVWH